MAQTADGNLRVGMRFDRRDARPLRTLEHRARHRELGEQQVRTFSLAAEAAETGEPLIVLCESLLEAQLMAAGYVRLGLHEPVLEDL